MVISQNYSTLLGTGVTMGIVHVLTGPDHLSALATLSANAGAASAFYLGVKWGLGHSTGLLLVGTVLIVLTKDDDNDDDNNDDSIRMPDGVTHMFESLVGIFMVFLGIYGMKRAWEKRPKPYDTVEPGQRQGDDAEVEIGNANQEDPSVVVLEDSNVIATTTDNPSPHHHHNHSWSWTAVTNHHQPESTATYFEQENTRPCRCCRFYFNQLLHRLSTGVLALLAGIVHGMAGPGGVLGVIPAVQLHNGKLASMYLGAFCLSSTLTMGVFAILYGTLSSRLGRGGTGQRREFVIEFVSASLSLVVGVTWLILLSLGKLEDIFP